MRGLGIGDWRLGLLYSRTGSDLFQSEDHLKSGGEFTGHD